MSMNRPIQARRHEDAKVHPSTASGPASRSTVKNSLTPNRRRRSVENDEYASFIRRVLRAYTRRVAAGDIDALADMTGLAAELEVSVSPGPRPIATAGHNQPGLAPQRARCPLVSLRRSAAVSHQGPPRAGPSRSPGRSESAGSSRTAPRSQSNEPDAALCRH